MKTSLSLASLALALFLAGVPRKPKKAAPEKSAKSETPAKPQTPAKPAAKPGTLDDDVLKLLAERSDVDVGKKPSPTETPSGKNAPEKSSPASGDKKPEKAIPGLDDKA